MAIEEMFTDLPAVSSAQMSDIICAVQGYVSPSVLGLSVQESLQQVYNLFQSNIILFNAGNPNGSVAGTTYQFCWDTTNSILYLCTTSGTSSTAVWTKVGGANPLIFQWLTANSSTQAMLSNRGYLKTNVGLTTFTLPTTSAFGDKISIIGNGTGGWTIAQSIGQTIQIGSSVTTTGVGGSLSSTNQYDALELICIQANLAWQNNAAPQGNLTIV